MRDNIDFEREYQQRGAASQRHYPNEALIQFLARRFFRLTFEERAKIRILEVGCGSGANLWMSAREGFNIHGVDIAPTGLRLCRETLGRWDVQARLSAANMRSLPFVDRVFDVIYDVHSMQHTDLEGHWAAYGEVFRCLKQGGHFFQFHLGSESYCYREGGGLALDAITIDNVRNEEAPYTNGGLIAFLDVHSAENMLKTAGFEKIEIDRLLRTQFINSGKPINTEFFSIACRRPGA